MVGAGQVVPLVLDIHVDPLGVLAVAEQRRRQRNAGVARCGESAQLAHRVIDQRFDRYARVDQLVDERRIGTVLQQATHQIGQQVLVRADRGVDAYVAGVLLDHRVVQGIAHAVQALELELARL